MVEDQGKADGYYFGQVTKYLFRQGHKPDAPPIQDLEKAHWYMARWVAWTKYGRRIWKLVRAEPEIVFDPTRIAEEVNRT